MTKHWWQQKIGRFSNPTKTLLNIMQNALNRTKGVRFGTTNDGSSNKEHNNC